MHRYVSYLGFLVLLLALPKSGWGSTATAQLSVAPTVTVNQAVGQVDPTNATPIHFTVVFSEVVKDFAAADVTLAGTAPGARVSAVTGAGANYDVAVSGMTSSGTVVARLAAGVAHDANGNANTASTSTDNTLTYVDHLLASAATFAAFGGGAGLTNQGVYTVVNGDIGTTGVSTKVTGFHDRTGDKYTETPLDVGNVTGRIYTAAPPPVIYAPGGPYGGTAATKAIADAGAADALSLYNHLKGLPTTGPDPSASGQLGGITLAPGIYKAAGGSFGILPGKTLTLDAKGNPNAVWVFQMGSSFTVGAIGAGGTPAKVVFKNGLGQGGNVYWQVGSSATINTGATMVGTIVAYAGITLSTPGQVILTTLDGRVLALNASVTMVNTHINVPVATALGSIAVNPGSVTGSLSSTGTVNLYGFAPAGGATVTLTSSNSAVAKVPASIVVGDGQTAGVFTISTTATAKSTPVTITATTNGVSSSTVLVVVPIVLGSFTLNPSPITGGLTSKGTVILTAPAPTGGLVVTLQSTTFYASLQSSVTVPAGSSSATFNVQSHPVTTPSDAKLYASCGGVTVITYLHVIPPLAASVSFAAPSVTGSLPATGTLTLTGPAPTGGTTVTITSSNTAAATVTATLVVPAGKTSATFIVSTKTTVKTASATITATTNGVSKTAILVVNPIVLASFTLNPSSVTGGLISTGTATLTAPAPTGGLIVTLQFTTFYASVAPSVAVLAGHTSATFNVQSHAVTTPSDAKLYASCGGVSIITYLHVVPVSAHAVPTGPPAPSEVSASTDGGVVTVEWTAVGGATRYTVKRSISAAGPYDVLGIVQTPSMSCEDTASQAGATWYYVVSAGDANGDGPGSTPVAVQP